MMIKKMPHYVDFKTAVFLKEKGFDIAPAHIENETDYVERYRPISEKEFEVEYEAVKKEISECLKNNNSDEGENKKQKLEDPIVIVTKKIFEENHLINELIKIKNDKTRN